MMLRKTKGFSLIELLIVMAIVGVLAAIAVPAYRDYMIRTKIGVAMQFLSAQVTKATEYMNRNGSFPYVTDLGYTPAPASGFPSMYSEQQLDPANYMAPYISQLIMFPAAMSFGTCQVGNVVGMISNFDGPASNFSNSGRAIELHFTLVESGGVVSQACYYIPVDFSGASVSYNIPGCYNAYDATEYATYNSILTEYIEDCVY